MIVSPHMLKRLIEANQATSDDRVTALKPIEALTQDIPRNDLSEIEISKLVDQEVKAVRARKQA